MNRITLLLIGIFACCTQLKAESPFELKTGDLVFQTNKGTSFVRAIKEVTTSIDSLNFSHVGVVTLENGQPFVIEAISGGVLKTPFEKFLKQSELVNGKPVVVVGRLKARYRGVIPRAMQKLETLLGKPYDYVFSPFNDLYYCSEIIYVAYRRPSGRPIFYAPPMSFKDKNTGETLPYWIKHFKRHGAPIPEGETGTSPGDLSKSHVLKIVHRYF